MWHHKLRRFSFKGRFGVSLLLSFEKSISKFSLFKVAHSLWFCNNSHPQLQGLALIFFQRTLELFLCPCALSPIVLPETLESFTVLFFYPQLQSSASCSPDASGFTSHAWVSPWHLSDPESRQSHLPLWEQQPEGWIPQEQQGHIRSYGLWPPETSGSRAWCVHSHLKDLMLMTNQ